MSLEALNCDDDDICIVDFPEYYEQFSVAIRNSISLILCQGNQKYSKRSTAVNIEYGIGLCNGQISFAGDKYYREQAKLFYNGIEVELMNYNTDIIVKLQKNQEIDIKYLYQIDDMFVEVDQKNEAINIYRDYQKQYIQNQISLNDCRGILQIRGKIYGELQYCVDHWIYKHNSRRVTSKIWRGQKMIIKNNQQLILGGEQISIDFQCY